MAYHWVESDSGQLLPLAAWNVAVFEVTAADKQGPTLHDYLDVTSKFLLILRNCQHDRD